MSFEVPIPSRDSGSPEPGSTPVQVPVPAPKYPLLQVGQIWLESVLQVSVTAQLAPGMVLQAHGEASTT